MYSNEFVFLLTNYSEKSILVAQNLKESDINN
jgi:hypothetical protein